jgi:hypothetical protein
MESSSVKPPAALSLILVFSLLIALFTLPHYGESWDELKLYDYASDSLEAYPMWLRHGAIPVTGDRFENYGPAFVMFTYIITKASTRIVPGMLEVDVQHFVYFVTFLLGVWAFLQLASRWMSRIAALGATLLFMTQPLFWGHAFINPKDIPLLSFFLLAVYLGLRMHDSFFGAGRAPSLETTSAWADLPSRTRNRLVVATIFWLAALVLLYGGTPVIYRAVENAVLAAAGGEPSLITAVAPRVLRIGPESYIEKFFVLFLWLRAALFLVLSSVLVWLYRRNFPLGLRTIAAILPAGIILGLSISVRIFGIWAAVLVAGCMLWRSGKKAWPVLAVYALTAWIAMYLTWPYLWPDPLGHFFETVMVMSQHPWPGSVLFNGATYPANDLPASYLPTLLAIQLTEPVWVLFFLGMALAVFGAVRRQPRPLELLALTGAWFIVPLIALVVLRPTLYDNFRQAFFIVPPVFFTAGLVFDWIRRPTLQGALIALVVLPGLIASSLLHPYEYVYYNRFLGGAAAAADRFELEYWGTSYRAAAAEANRLAPPNANVWVDGPAHLFATFARPDFHLYYAGEPERADHYDVVVTLARYNWEKTSFPEARIVYRVMREGALFALIRIP